MTKTLLLVPVLAAACIDPALPERPDDAPTDPVDIAVTTRAGDAPVVIATGGIVELAIDDPASVGLSGDATEGYAVEPAGLVWPNMKAPLYYVRAEGAGAGSFEIATNHGIATGLVHSADVATIALAPADYVLDGSSPFAVDVTRRDVQVVLRDRDGGRLVDASLGIAVAQTAWDRGTLPATVGRHVVTVYADSFGDRSVAIDVVDAGATIDRVEPTVDGDRVCFHAYAGDTEVATAMTLTGGTPIAGAANCATGSVTTIAAHVGG